MNTHTHTRRKSRHTTVTRDLAGWGQCINAIFLLDQRTYMCIYMCIYIYIWWSKKELRDFFDLNIETMWKKSGFAIIVSRTVCLLCWPVCPFVTSIIYWEIMSLGLQVQPLRTFWLFFPADQFIIYSIQIHFNSKHNNPKTKLLKKTCNDVHEFVELWYFAHKLNFKKLIIKIPLFLVAAGTGCSFWRLRQFKFWLNIGPKFVFRLLLFLCRCCSHCWELLLT